MSDFLNTIKDLVTRPEKIVPAFESRRVAYLMLYILPMIIFAGIFASAVANSSVFLVYVLPFMFIAMYFWLALYAYRDYHITTELHSAANQVLPNVLVKYFKTRFPSNGIPMFVSADRNEWVAYGHIDKIKMAREMTYLDYRLMPPPPKLTEHFFDNESKIQHSYLLIDCPESETFIIKDSVTDSDIAYPVTVYYREES